MKILCRHGHYAFFPDFSTEIAEFSRHFRTELVRQEDFFTFPLLKNLAGYALKGKIFSGELVANTNFSGNPWEIMDANSFVYSLTLKRLVPKTTVTVKTLLLNAGGYLLSPTPFVQAGSFAVNDQRIVDYFGFLSDDYKQLRISEVRLD
jgi:hypothetical protein